MDRTHRHTLVSKLCQLSCPIYRLLCFKLFYWCACTSQCLWCASKCSGVDDSLCPPPPPPLIQSFSYSQLHTHAILVHSDFSLYFFLLFCFHPPIFFFLSLALLVAAAVFGVSINSNTLLLDFSMMMTSMMSMMMVLLFDSKLLSLRFIHFRSFCFIIINKL